MMQRTVAAVSEEDPLSLALQVMLWQRIHHLPVLRGGHVVGVISETDLLKHSEYTNGQRNLRGNVRDAMSREVVTIDPEGSLSDAAARLAVGNVGCLPVVQAGKLVGIVTTTDVLAETALAPVRSDGIEHLGVRDAMAQDVISVFPDQPLLDATATMVKHGVRHLPVVDGTQRVVGMLSDRDVRQVVGDPLGVFDDAARRSRLQATKVSDAMTPDPRCLLIEDPLSSAVELFASERFGAVPVVDADERLAGLLSYVDVLRCVAEHLEG